ncbi:OmpA family protein [Tamlana sp. I1]|uniref:OmpA family protein n=1 Tax=Tamlana sp. I1 TaxID=2762061 RepID=UPI00188F30EC|nr:OmpA family protein [Tamlana sp. I1]
MKTKLCFLIFLVSHMVFSQSTKNANTAENTSIKTSQSTKIGPNGFLFEMQPTTINSDFSEIGSGFFRNKFIMVSAKKIGALAKIDHNTNEAYKELYCVDVDAENGALHRPLSYSRIINTQLSEDQITFSKDEKTAYFTRSTHENSLEFKLYKTTLEKDSKGNWIDETLLDINKPNVSIETPFINHTGDKLYFAANYPDSKGGFDIYVANINSDGSLGAPKNLGSTINTVQDEKYPALSLDDHFLYFASKGHENIGGYDIFRSEISKDHYKSPRNLGSTINTENDEIAFFLATENRGYVSSNKAGGVGSYDIYIAINKHVNQTLRGIVSDLDTHIKLPNTQLSLLNDEGEVVGKTVTAEDGSYTFNVAPLENYSIIVHKDGFENTTIPFYADKGIETEYTQNIELETIPPIVTETNIVLENIYFDFNKWNVKEESFISLNKIAKVLNDNPNMKLAINAHTDNKGSASYNLRLSEKRAASAVNYLVKNGISKSRLKSKGYGESEPLIDCKNNCSAEDLQANRRIEFVIIK